MIRIGTLVAVTLLLAACQAPQPLANLWDQSGRKLFPYPESPSTQTVSERIVPGVTTRTEVYNLLGAPNNVAYPQQRATGINDTNIPPYPVGTQEIWSYHQSATYGQFAIDPRPVRFQSQVARVLFDYRGVVLDAQMLGLTR